MKPEIQWSIRIWEKFVVDDYFGLVPDWVYEAWARFDPADGKWRGL